MNAMNTSTTAVGFSGNSTHKVSVDSATSARATTFDTSPRPAWARSNGNPGSLSLKPMPSMPMRDHVRDSHLFAEDAGSLNLHEECDPLSPSFTRTFDWFELGSPLKKRCFGSAGGTREGAGDQSGLAGDEASTASEASTDLCGSTAARALADESPTSDGSVGAVAGSVGTYRGWDQAKSVPLGHYARGPTNAVPQAEQAVGSAPINSLFSAVGHHGPTNVMIESEGGVGGGAALISSFGEPRFASCPQMAGHQQTSQQMPLHVMLPPPPCGLPVLPPAAPAHPPGSWIAPPQQHAASGSLAHARAVPEEIRLVKATRAPPPLHHNKSQPVTSLTINHIPFLMRRGQLCALLDETGFAGRYNYVYVPCNHDKSNRGHAFVNFYTPQDAKDFFASWHGARLVGAGSDAPVLSVAVSVAQGFEASTQKWTVAKLQRLKDEDLRPFIAGMTD